MGREALASSVLVCALVACAAARLMAFAALFQGRGFRGDICAPFGPFFAEAVALIESACEDFVPVG